MDLAALRETLLDPAVIWTVTLGTLGLAIASAAAVPLLVVRLPADYFAEARPPFLHRLMRAGPLGRLWLVFKNLLGVVLGLLGVAMLVLPGQGLLTILLALVLLDLPKKHLLERRLVRRPGVRRALDRLRARFDRPPFDIPDA